MTTVSLVKSGAIKWTTETRLRNCEKFLKKRPARILLAPRAFRHDLPSLWSKAKQLAFGRMSTFEYIL